MCCFVTSLEHTDVANCKEPSMIENWDRTNLICWCWEDKETRLSPYPVDVNKRRCRIILNRMGNLNVLISYEAPTMERYGTGTVQEGTIRVFRVEAYAEEGNSRQQWYSVCCFVFAPSVHSYFSKMERVKFSETSLTFYRSAWRHISEDGILHRYHLESQNVTCFACVPKEWIIGTVMWPLKHYPLRGSGS